MYRFASRQALRVDLLTGGYMLDRWEKVLMYTSVPLFAYSFPFISLACMTLIYLQLPPITSFN